MDVIDFTPFSLKQRRFLVTGASSGIGRATAVALSRLGAEVTCVGRNANRLHETLSILSGDGHMMEEFDLKNLEMIPSWMSTISEKSRGFHGFVHAAGIRISLPLRAMTLNKWRETMLINTEAALVLCRSFIQPKIYAGENGSIVFISSVMGAVGAPGASAYAMSKGALDGLVRSLAIELAPLRIRVNSIAPGCVDTPMWEGLSRIWNEEQKIRIENLHPLGLGKPEYVANAASFLLSDAARWITGTTLVVDGGYLAQ